MRAVFEIGPEAVAEARHQGMRLTSTEADVPAIAEAEAIAAPMQALAALRMSTMSTDSVVFRLASSGRQLNGDMWSITLRRLSSFALPTDLCRQLRRH